MYPKVLPLTRDGVAPCEPPMSRGVEGKQHASERGTLEGVKPADKTRTLPARTGKGRYHEVYPDLTIGCQGLRRTRKLCRAPGLVPEPCGKFGWSCLELSA